MSFTLMTCGECGVQHQMPTALYNECKKQGPKKTWYCPNGHARIFARSTAEIDQLEQERNNLRQQIARAEDEKREALEAKTRAERKLKTVQRRANAGVCQCCNRTFTNMARHMATKHPELKSEPLGKFKVVK